MNSIKVRATTAAYADVYDINVETSADSRQPSCTRSDDCWKASAVPVSSSSPSSTAKEKNMSSEKPFWEGKTCKEMAGLHIKVTFKNGDVATGVADKNGDIKSAYVLTLGMGDDLFVPEANIESIELVDDPEYERIDDIENVQVGDIACTTEGNHFPVIDLKPAPLGDMLLRIRISEIDGEYCIDSDDFAYALRRKPKLPDHDGLWLDKDDAIWQVCDHQAVPVYDDADEWGIQREVFLVSQLVQHAPFRPAKAVEA